MILSNFDTKVDWAFKILVFTKSKEIRSNDQRWSRGNKARGQGHKKNLRPRTAFPRTDTLEAKDRNARGQGQGPRTQAQVLSKKKRSPKKNKKAFTKIFQAISKKKKVFTKIFQAISKKKKGLHKHFSSDLHKKMFSKKFFKRSTKLCCPQAEVRPIFEDLRPRGQGLDLRGQGRPRGLHLW